MNKNNFWRAKECMQVATKEQADANVRALLEWKNKLGPELWRELYVVIPTVWPMSRTNTRFELFRGLLDHDRVETNIFCSEYPRTMDESRALLGRIVGDRPRDRAAGVWDRLPLDADEDDGAVDAGGCRQR